MTLVTTEIWPGLPGFIVMAADQRISRAGQHDSNHRKLFALPAGRRGGISYFGLAEVQLATSLQRMDRWLSDFLDRHTTGDLAYLAASLAGALNGLPRLDRTQRSGFQLAGLVGDNRPEFWYIRNVDDDGEPTLGQWEAREDFQARDAAALPPGHVQYYRSGDIQAHVAAWQPLDVAFGQLLTRPGFRLPVGPEPTMQWVQFKMNVVADFYDNFATTSIIGRPVDALAVTETGVIASWAR